MKDHVLAADLAREDDTVLVLAVDARSVADVARWVENVVGRDETDPRADRRIAGVGDRVPLLVGEIGDSRVLDAPFLIRRLTCDRGRIADLVDGLTIRRDGH